MELTEIKELTERLQESLNTPEAEKVFAELCTKLKALPTLPSDLLLVVDPRNENRITRVVVDLEPDMDIIYVSPERGFTRFDVVEDDFDRDRAIDLFAESYPTTPQRFMQALEAAYSRDLDAE